MQRYYEEDSSRTRGNVEAEKKAYTAHVTTQAHVGLSRACSSDGPSLREGLMVATERAGQILSLVQTLRNLRERTAAILHGQKPTDGIPGKVGNPTVTVGTIDEVIGRMSEITVHLEAEIRELDSLIGNA